MNVNKNLPLESVSLVVCSKQNVWLEHKLMHQRLKIQPVEKRKKLLCGLADKRINNLGKSYSRLSGLLRNTVFLSQENTGGKIWETQAGLTGVRTQTKTPYAGMQCQTTIN